MVDKGGKLVNKPPIRCSGCRRLLWEDRFFDLARLICRQCYAGPLGDNIKNEKKLARQKKSRLKKYGLTETAFDMMFLLQNCKCAICDKLFINRSSAYIDHDHASGNVRGLLCAQCNYGLGQFGDNPKLMIRATTYILKTNEIRYIGNDIL